MVDMRTVHVPQDLWLEAMEQVRLQAEREVKTADEAMKRGYQATLYDRMLANTPSSSLLAFVKRVGRQTC